MLEYTTNQPTFMALFGILICVLAAVEIVFDVKPLTILFNGMDRIFEYLKKLKRKIEANILAFEIILMVKFRSWGREDA